MCLCFVMEPFFFSTLVSTAQRTLLAMSLNNMFRTLIACAILLWLCNVNVECTQIVFGQSAAFTGVSSQLGLDMREGIMAAFKEINDVGGIKGNYTFDLIAYDDQYEPSNATTNTLRLISEDNVFGLVGYVGTPTSLAALSVRNGIDNNIPFVAPLTGSKGLRLPVDQTIINTRSSYLDETAAMVDYLVNERFISRISIMYQNDSFGAAGYQGLNVAMAAVGLKIESEGTYERNTENVEDAFSSIFTKDPQAIVMIGTYAPLAKFVSLAKGQNTSIVFFTVSFVGAEVFVKELLDRGVDLDDIYVTEVLPLYAGTSPYLIKEYQAALKAYNPTAAISSVSFEGYIAGRFVIEIVRQAYPDISRKNFLDVVYTSQYFTLSGLLLGPYSSQCTQGMRSVSLLQMNATGSLSAVPDVTFSWTTCLSSDGTIISPIVFGQSAPLEGTVKELGIGMRQGILASFAARNRLGGIRNRKLVLISRDDGYEPTNAVANAKYLISEQNVFALVGSVGTPTTSAVLPVIEQENTPLIGALTGAKIFRKPCNRNIVNVRASYIDEVAAMTRHFIDNLGLQRISIFYQNDTFGKAGLEGLQLALGNRSMTIESQGTYERNTFELSAGLSSIQQGNPDAIVMVGTYGQLAQFVQMADGWRSGLVYGTVSFVDSEAFARALRSTGITNENIYVTQVVPDPSDSTDQLVALYQNALLDYDPTANFGFVSLEGYVVGEFLIKVLDSIDNTLDITRGSFLDTVFSQAVFKVGGLSIGPFSGTADNCTCNQGLHRVITTRIFPSLNFTISDVPENDFRFDTCGVNYPQAFISVSLAVRAGVITASSACVALVIAFIVLTLYFRESKTIKHSSLVFSLLTLVGAGLMMFSPIFIVLESPQCMPWMWFFGVGFVFFFGSMAVKSYRIDRIFNWHRKKLTKIKPIGDSQLMIIVSILLGLEVVLLIVWHVMARLRALQFEGTYDSIFGCYSDEAFPFIIAQIVYFGVVFLVGCFFAFRTRNVNIGSYKETKEIFFSVYNMTLLFIIIMPLVGLIGVNHTETAAIITSIGLLFAVVISVLCLFVLKFYRIINKREKLSYSSTVSGTPGNYRGSSYMSNNESANKSKSSYVEVSKKDEKEKTEKSAKSESSSSSEESSSEKGKALPVVVNRSTDLLLPPANNSNQNSQILEEPPSSPMEQDSSDSESEEK